MEKFDVLYVKIFTDNYIWILVNNENHHCVIVDPGDAEPLLNFVQTQQLIPIAILITHHHRDHSAGIADIVSQYNIPVYGSIQSQLNEITHPVDETSLITFEKSDMVFNVMSIPGHTLDHIGYIFHDVLFCGDTLFSGGCGKVFEGSYEQMFSSLNKIAALPDETKIYCTHEYTLSNLLFAYKIDPENIDLNQYITLIKEKIKKGLITLPSTLELEKRINPFLRCDNAAFVTQLEKQADIKFNDSLAVFRYIRELKNAQTS
ncbi:MAG: hydroxyacylglutathione hydrolase [Gammaproteobacteria bacterium]|nr:hydroxyacylglutathione hydrolase [Gammaproteobacteria bacterium]